MRRQRTDEMPRAAKWKFASSHDAMASRRANVRLGRGFSTFTCPRRRRSPRAVVLFIAALDGAGLSSAATGPNFSKPTSYLMLDLTRILESLRLGERRPARRTALTFPLLPPPQKNRSAPSDSSPDTPTPAGISRLSRTSPVSGSTRRKSLSSPSHVACQSSPWIQLTPVTKRLVSIVRRIAPVSASI